ncbi:hypothetical protein NPIL_403691 [Nephila pilipes]|uniref:Uncharacterized protein n=1 Tax=Nephila pilipes TaxID=299642 RepID=A0A8X6USF9_NEPPI|nr:hypothetical protein NPIL_403691 [Nephila pilipes]
MRGKPRCFKVNPESGATASEYTIVRICPPHSKCRPSTAKRRSTLGQTAVSMPQPFSIRHPLLAKCLSKNRLVVSSPKPPKESIPHGPDGSSSGLSSDLPNIKLNREKFLFGRMSVKFRGVWVRRVAIWDHF